MINSLQVFDQEIGTFPLIQNGYFLLHYNKQNGKMGALTRSGQMHPKCYYQLEGNFHVYIFKLYQYFFLRYYANFNFWKTQHMFKLY